MKRVFGTIEAIFDLLYLIAALALGVVLLMTAEGRCARTLAGAMALTLAFGDAFHLVPRVMAVLTRDEERFQRALGRGKQIASITMTAFYVLLWHIGLAALAPGGSILWSYAVYLLAAVRIALCLAPQNRWQERYPPVSWGIWRNVPFFLLGAIVAGLFFLHGAAVPGLSRMGLAIALSFGFYLPVVLWSNANPRIGMLMLPKTCAYVWMLIICLSL